MNASQPASFQCFPFLQIHIPADHRSDFPQQQAKLWNGKLSIGWDCQTMIAADQKLMPGA
jgi:hypothetical protein